MGDRLYVSGLPYAITEGQLHDIFAEHGTVASARIVTDRYTGRSRGFGFVEMGSEVEAQAAMEALNDLELQGRVLKVNEAKERGSGGSSDRS
jgi:RNA recognition motif-containing protein